MKSTKLSIILVVVMGLVLMATANAEYRTLRQDRPVIVLEDHPWGGEVTGGGAVSVDKIINPDLIGTPFSFINDIRIIIMSETNNDDNDNGILPDEFGSNGGNHNGLKGN